MPSTLAVTAALCVLLTASTAAADITLGQLLPKAMPGGELSLAGTNLDTKKINDYTVTFRRSADYNVPIERLEPSRLVVRVPSNFTPGPYLAYVKVESGAPQFIAQIEIVPVVPQVERVTVISTWKKLLIDGRFDFKVLGDCLCVDQARTMAPCTDGAMPPTKTGATGSEPMTLYLGRLRFELTRCSEGPARLAGARASGSAPQSRRPASTVEAASGAAQQPPAAASGDPAVAPGAALDAVAQPSAVASATGSGAASEPGSQSAPANAAGVSGETSQAKSTEGERGGPALCYEVESPQELTIHGLDVSEFGGAHDMSIAIAGLHSSVRPLRISRVTPRMIKWIALGLLVGFVATLGLIGTTASVVNGGSRRRSLLTWVLLDGETNTYSLSKAQLLLWTGAIVFGYVYLLLAYALTQGRLVFPPLPMSMSWLIAGAGGTTVAAAALSKSRGPKGAGPADPSFSDLVSAGGVLAADRAQFFIWTLIGVFGFILLVLRQLPDQITQLPDVPAELLTAMGLSAGVYVLGKSVRLPGPVITSVAVTSGATFDLKIDGQNLHERATISVDGQPVADARIVPPAAPPTNSPAPGMSPQLVVQLPGVGPWTSGDHLLRVTNIDGQFAETWFAANPPKLTSISPTSIAAGVQTQVTLTGSDLRGSSVAEWLPPGATTPIVLDPKNVSAQPTTATVSLNPGKVKGAGTLTLVSPHGMRASQPLTIT